MIKKLEGKIIFGDYSKFNSGNQIKELINSKNLKIEQNILSSHSSEIVDIQFINNQKTRETKFFISVDGAGVLKMWKINKQKSIRENVENEEVENIKTIQAHNKCINGCDMNKIIPTACTCSDDKTIKIWDLNKLEQISIEKSHKSFVNCCRYERTSGNLIISSSMDNTIRVWDCRSSKSGTTLHTSEQVNSVDFYFPESYHFISGSQNGKVSIYDIRINKELSSNLDSQEKKETEWIHKRIERKKRKKEEMEAKQIANEEQKNQKQQKYTTALDNKLHQALYSQLSTWSWGMDLQISNKITSSKKTTDLPFAKFSNKNQSSKSSFNKFYQEYILPFKGHDPLKDIYSVCVSNTGLFVLSSSQDNSHNVWNSSNRSGLFTLQGAKLSTKCNPKFSQFDDWVVCGSDNGKILFWIIDPRSQSRQDQQINVFEFLKIHKHPVSCVNLNEDNSVLVSGDLSGRINVRTSEFYD